MNSADDTNTFWGLNKLLWQDPRTWLVLLAITEKNIFRYLMLVLNTITGVEFIGDLILHFCYVVLIVLCFQRGCRLSIRDILIILFVVLAILLTWMIYPANIEDYMFGEDQFWPVVFPLFRYFIVGLFLIPNRETIILMGKVSCLAIVVESIFVFYFLRGSDLQSYDDMSRAYFILLNVLLVINFTFEKKTILGIVFSVVGFLFLASMGTRGPIVISMTFAALKIIQTSINRGHSYLAIASILLFFWFINSIYWTSFLLSLRGMIELLGLSTRVLDYAIQGITLTYYSDRDTLAQLVFSKIKERPLTGWGVYGEWQFCGWSAHNMYLEILDHYGVILGGIILLWMVAIIIKGLKVSKSSSAQGLMLLFICFTMVRGIFGGGFLTSQTFLMIGYCLQICRKTNIKSTLYGKTSNSSGRL